MTVIVDTSPLLLLSRIARHDLLVRLYEDILVPGAVRSEIGARPGIETSRLEELWRHERVHTGEAGREWIEAVPDDLGPGEREVIALGLERDPDLVILDDREGRRVAVAKGLQVTGTIGVIIEARSRGLISSVRREIDALVEAGMWIGEAFYHRLIQEFPE